MTPQEYVTRVEELTTFSNGDIVDQALLIPANILLDSIKNRISNEGLNSAGSSIGRYSTIPIYVRSSVFIGGGFNAQGKKVNDFGVTSGDRLVPSVRLKRNSTKRNPVKYSRYSTVKTNYKPRKSMYLKDGYKQLRSIQGLRTDIMNFKYRGDLLASYRSERQGLTIVQGFTDVKNSGKRQGLEKKFGRVFAATQQEINIYTQAVDYQLNRITRSLLEGFSTSATIETF